MERTDKLNLILTDNSTYIEDFASVNSGNNDGVAVEKSNAQKIDEFASKLAGGQAGNVLLKKSNTDFDLTWGAIASGGGGGSANNLGPVKAGECWTPIFESGLLVRCVYFYTGDVDPGTVTIPADLKFDDKEEYYDFPIPFCLGAIALEVDGFSEYRVNQENALKVWNNKIYDVYFEIGTSTSVLDAAPSSWLAIKDTAIAEFDILSTATMKTTYSKPVPYSRHPQYMNELVITTTITSTASYSNDDHIMYNTMATLLGIQADMAFNSRALKHSFCYTYTPWPAWNNAFYHIKTDVVDSTFLYLVEVLFNLNPFPLSIQFEELSVVDGIGLTNYVIDNADGSQTLLLNRNIEIALHKQSIMTACVIVLDDGTSDGITLFPDIFPFATTQFTDILQYTNTSFSYGDISGNIAETVIYDKASDSTLVRTFHLPMQPIDMEEVTTDNVLSFLVYSGISVKYSGRNFIPKDADGNYYPLKQATFYYKGV
jgi:hypothetical protein